jgi:hypothetical protein
LNATAGEINLIGANVYMNAASLTSAASGASIVLKASNEIEIGVGSTTSIQSNNGNITLWADSDGNGAGPIKIRENVTFNSANGQTTQTTGGGAITLAGGSTTVAGIPTGYASAASTLTEIWGSNRSSGVQLGAFNPGTNTVNSIAFYSGGGNVTINGKSANSMPGITWMGSNSGTQIIRSGNGTISIDGFGDGAGHGIEFGFGGGSIGRTLESSNTSSSAISVTGRTTSSGAVAGFQGAATMRATDAGGGITVNGTTSASGYRSVEGSGLNLYASSGPIAINGPVERALLSAVTGVKAILLVVPVISPSPLPQEST